MNIKCLLSLFLVISFTTIQAQTLKLKEGHKFGYEVTYSTVTKHQQSQSKEYQYWKTHYKVLSHRNGLYTLRASHKVFISGNSDKMLDSTLPYKEQPGDFEAFLNKVLTQSSYELLIDETGEVVKVNGLAEIKKEVLAKLLQFQISDGIQTHHELAEIFLSGHHIKELSSFFLSNSQFTDSITGLKLSGTTNLEDTYTTPAGVQERRSIYKFNLIQSKDKFVKEQLPLMAEAKAQLEYEKYYSPINRAKHQIQEMTQAFNRDKGSQSIQAKIMKQLATLDKNFVKDDFEYLGAKLGVLTYLNSSAYGDLLSQVPYKYLPSEYDVLNKLGRELEQANFNNVKQAVKLCFTSFYGKNSYRMDTTYTSSRIHDTFGLLIHRIEDQDSLRTALNIINQINELQIPVATKMLKGMKTYVQAKLAIDESELAAISNTYFNSPYDKAVRYRILIYDELCKKQIPDSLKRAYIEYTIDLNRKNIEALQIFTGENKDYLDSRDIHEQQIVNKKNLADAYYRKSRLEKTTEMAYLQLAADYMPTPSDITLNASGLKTEYEFTPFISYADLYLAAPGNEKLTDELRFSKYVDMVILEPERYSALKENYASVFPKGDFKAFFSTSLKSKLSPTPQFSLNDRKGSLFTSKDQQDKFVFVDFWGTWCGACVSEIDKIEAVYLRNPSPDNLVVTTIACFDKLKDVNDFMMKEKYTYPVLMSDTNVEKDFKVISYPTKVLLLPNGVYVTIPYSDDYNTILEKYLKWEI